MFSTLLPFWENRERLPCEAAERKVIPLIFILTDARIARRVSELMMRFRRAVNKIVGVGICCLLLIMEALP